MEFEAHPDVTVTVPIASIDSGGELAFGLWLPGSDGSDRLVDIFEDLETATEVIKRRVEEPEAFEIRATAVPEDSLTEADSHAESVDGRAADPKQDFPVSS